MKTTLNIAIWILFLLISLLSNAQSFEGLWNAEMQSIPLIFKISKTDTGYTASMQSPKQAKEFFPADTAVVEGNKITIELKKFYIKYEGTLQSDVIEGMFSQGPGSNPLNFKRGDYKEVKLNRPQEPKGDLPYKSEEISFINTIPVDVNRDASIIQLAGTLTLPAGVKNPPVAILISGSGPQDRNEELLGHKPFLVLADYLTRKGIAVLRYDDRGVAESEGTQKNATSADFATDVYAAIQYLKTRNDIDSNKIGLIGHSEGGLIAPIVIAHHPEDIAFFISLAGTGLRGDKVLLPQMEKGSILSGASVKEVKEDMVIMKAVIDHIVNAHGVDIPEQALVKQLETIIEEESAKATTSIKEKYQGNAKTAVASQFASPWFRFFMAYDPAFNLQQVKCPVLALNGSLDFQVIPEINLVGMESAFIKSGNKDYTIKKIEGLNHLFQNAQTGSFSEYQELEETFDPKTLELMASWINKRF